MNTRTRRGACRSRGPATVRILHNNSPQAQFYGYTLLDTLTCVYAYDDPDVHPETREIEVAERANDIFTVGHTPAYGTPDPRAVAYRDRGNRSLSVGDVVCVDGRFLACEPFGWNEIDPPREISHERPGTTPHA